MNGRRVVITGIGAFTPLGDNAAQMWESLSNGTCGIDTIKAFDPVGFTCKIAGEVGEYNIRKHVPKYHRKATKLMSRDIELSVIAANEAVADAGLVTKATDPDNITVDPTRFAINIGAGLISCDLEELSPSVAASTVDKQFDIHKWGDKGLETLTPLWLLKYLPNMLACHIGIIHDIQGPSNSITCGESGGYLAIAEAAQVIDRDCADIALAGGCEAKVNPIVMIRQCLLNRATSENNDDPKTACRPFDADAKGSVFGEGAGIVILEELHHAQQRNAKIYAEIVGTGGSNSLNTDYEHLELDGKGVEIAIEQAMEEAGITPDDLDLIIPCGTGIPADDKAEAAGIEAALGSAVENIPTWPIKSMISHTGAAAGTLDVIAAVMVMSNDKIPPAINCDNKNEGCRLDIATETINKPVRYALCCGYSFGGQTAALVLKNYEGQENV